MYTAEGIVHTERADRYVEQLAAHLGHDRVGARTREPGDWDLRVDIAGGTVSARADPEGVLIRVEGPDADTLARLKEGVARRIVTIARRDGLNVTWSG